MTHRLSVHCVCACIHAWGGLPAVYVYAGATCESVFMGCEYTRSPACVCVCARLCVLASERSLEAHLCL